MWYVELAPAMLGVRIWSILGSNLQNLEPGLSSGSLLLLTKETTILKVYKRKK